MVPAARTSGFYGHTTEIIFGIAAVWVFLFLPLFLLFPYLIGMSQLVVAIVSLAGFIAAGLACLAVSVVDLTHNPASRSFKRTAALVVTTLLMIVTIVTLGVLMAPQL